MKRHRRALDSRNEENQSAKTTYGMIPATRLVKGTPTCSQKSDITLRSTDAQLHIENTTES